MPKPQKTHGFKAQMLLGDKLEEIKKIQSEGKKVAMSLSSVSVIVNALRLRKSKI